MLTRLHAFLAQQIQYEYFIFITWFLSFSVYIDLYSTYIFDMYS